MSSRSLRPSGRKIGVAALAASLGLAGLGLAASPASALPGFEFERLAGEDRIETAVDISQDTFATSDTALIARADLYPDALAGNYLAGAEQAPILLSHTDDVPAETLAELDRLNVTDVTLLGGTAALDESVVTELEAAGFTVGREAGTDRYKTAAEIATSQDAATIGEVDGLRTALLATGEKFPDALAGGPLAYAGNHPILLTPTATLGADAAGALDALGIEQVLILGGPAAVSAAAEAQVEALGIETQRLQGNTRYDTATAIAEFALTQGFSDEHVNVATGQKFPDALTGGPHAGEELTPIILANEGNTAEACGYLEDHADSLVDGHIYGGTAAVSAVAEAILEECAQGADAGQVTLTNASAAQGGTFSGVITGDAVSATVSGCGFTNEPLQDQNLNTAGIQFTETVSSAQAAGNCTLTFTITRADGTTATEAETLTVTAAPGQATATIRPELTSASIVRTTTTTQAGPSNPAGTTIRYVFDESVNNGTVGAPALYLAYSSNGTQYTGDAAIKDPNATNAILVTFTDTALQQAAGAATLTVATVDPAAISDGVLPNPEGDAALGTGTNQTVTRASGVTAEPDLQSVGGFRAAFQPGTATEAVAVDFTFDEAAFLLGNEVVGGGDALNDFALILADNTQVACEAPSNGSTTPASGGTVPGGQGSTTITVICYTTNGALASNPAVRGVVYPSTVSDNDLTDGDQTNVLQIAEINNGGNTSAAVNAPDLVSVQFFNGTGAAGEDQAVYTFDTNVTTTIDATGFFVYDDQGDEDAGVTAVRNPSNASQVIVTFGDTVAADDAVGGGVTDGAVQSALNAGASGANQEDEAGGTPLNPTITSTGTPGRTDGPDLTDVRLTAVRDVAGNLTGAVATYVFDEDVDQANVDETKLFLLLADGTYLTCTQPDAGPEGALLTEETDNTVTCATYGASTAATILSAVAGTVQDGAVDDEDTGTDNVGVNSNPEGYQVVSSGSTGTPRQA